MQLIKFKILKTKINQILITIKIYNKIMNRIKYHIILNIYVYFLIKLLFIKLN